MAQARVSGCVACATTFCNSAAVRSLPNRRETAIASSINSTKAGLLMWSLSMRATTSRMSFTFRALIAAQQSREARSSPVHLSAAAMAFRARPVASGRTTVFIRSVSALRLLFACSYASLARSLAEAARYAVVCFCSSAVSSARTMLAGERCSEASWAIENAGDSRVAAINRDIFMRPTRYRTTSSRTAFARSIRQLGRIRPRSGLEPLMREVHAERRPLPADAMAHALAVSSQRCRIRAARRPRFWFR